MFWVLIQESTSKFCCFCLSAQFTIPKIEIHDCDERRSWMMSVTLSVCDGAEPLKVAPYAPAPGLACARVPGLPGEAASWKQRCVSCWQETAALAECKSRWCCDIRFLAHLLTLRPDHWGSRQLIRSLHFLLRWSEPSTKIR